MVWSRRGSRSLGKLAIATAFLLLAPPSARADAGPSSYDLYLSGKPSEALAAARRDLALANETGTLEQRWSHLMHVGWLEESIGEHRSAMNTAGRALDVAAKLKDRRKIGRSLCWLGWSATSLGLYPLALEFYDDAIATATRDDDVVHPMVWGLATQEKGSILAKTGELAQGAALIEETTDYARRRGILVGVAEGGAHLAGIALQQGDLVAAERLAEEAVRASERCGCSAFNTNRARVMLARVAVERSRTNPKFRGDALEKIEQALEGAELVADRRHIAEARLLLSYSIDPDDLQRRQELVSSAAELLHETESELRGTADGQLGALLLESDELELAATYLRSGFELNEELLRRVDSAYILGDLAQIDELEDDTQAALAKWVVAAEEAEAAGAWVLAAEGQERLSDDLHRLGFSRLALDWTVRALGSLEPQLASARDPERRDHLARRVLRLGERRVEIELALEHATASPAPPPDRRDALGAADLRGRPSRAGLPPSP